MRKPARPSRQLSRTAHRLRDLEQLLHSPQRDTSDTTLPGSPGSAIGQLPQRAHALRAAQIVDHAGDLIVVEQELGHRPGRDAETLRYAHEGYLPDALPVSAGTFGAEVRWDLEADHLRIDYERMPTFPRIARGPPQGDLWCDDASASPPN